MLKVPIYQLKDFAPSLVGWILLENRQLSCEPQDITALKNILRSKARSSDFKAFDPKQDPEGWLKALPSTYYGSYFWAGNVQSS